MIKIYTLAAVFLSFTAYAKDCGTAAFKAAIKGVKSTGLADHCAAKPKSMSKYNDTYTFHLQCTGPAGEDVSKAVVKLVNAKKCVFEPISFTSDKE